MRFIITRLLVAALGLIVVLPAVGSAQTASSPNDSLNGKVRVYPNPWSASKLSQHFAGRTGSSVADTKSGYSRISFVRIPSTCTIRIYTVDGDLVSTIENKPRNNVPAYSTTWNMISDSDQYVVSGIYVFVVQTPDGQTEVGKLIIIR